MKCIICYSENIKKIDLIDKNELLILYNQLMQLDISSLVNTDLEFIKCCNCGLAFFHPAITGDERFYQRLQQFSWYYLNEKNEFKIAQKHICKTDKVLEVGCGKGAFAKYVNILNYTGLDFSINAKQVAASNGVHIENIDITEYAQSHSNTFDIVTSFQVLEHIANPREFLKAKVQATKPGGKIIISVPSEDSFIKYATNNMLNMPPHHITRWSDATLIKVATIFGLEIISIEHDIVQDIHKQWYIKTMLDKLMSNTNLIDLSVKAKIKNKLSSFLANVIAPRVPREFLSDGHTVTVIYRKPL